MPRKPRKPAGPPPDLLEPWDRQPGETDEAWEAWLVYKDQPLPRSYRRAARHLNKSLTVIAKHGDRWGWQLRAARWDTEQQRVKDRAKLDELEKMGREQANALRAARVALDAPSRELIRRLTEDPEGQFLRGIDVEELVRLVGTSARAMNRIVVAERLVAGETTDAPGEATAEEVRSRVRGMSDAEVRGLLGGVDHDEGDEGGQVVPLRR